MELSYYKELMAAYVRGYAMRTGVPKLSERQMNEPVELLEAGDIGEIFEAGRHAELKLYRFKHNDVLPRVRRVLGFLRGISFENLLDVGSGRGVFLYPLLDAFPYLPVTSLDILDYRVQFLSDISRGGFSHLTAVEGNICDKPFADKFFDVVTVLEVLEHIPDVSAAVRAVVRLARKFIVVSVPSKEDSNPEHIHLLTKARLTELFAEAGCSNLSFDGVNGHLIMIARLD